MSSNVPTFTLPRVVLQMLPILRFMLIAVGLISTSALFAQDADTFGPQIKAVLSKAKALHERLKRSGDSAQRVLAEQSIVLRDSIDGGAWEFSTKVTGVIERDSVHVLRADCPTALVPFLQNDAAYTVGGLFSFPIEISIPENSVASFEVGDEIKISGSSRALFGNDVAKREPSDPTIVLFDLCMPPIAKKSPVRIEVSLSNPIIFNSKISLSLVSPSTAKPDKDKNERDANQPPLEAALQELQVKVERLVTEAMRQKNTALVTELLETRQQEVEKWFVGQVWDFQTLVSDVESIRGEYILKCGPPKCLQRFLGLSGVTQKGGLRSEEPIIVIDRELAELLGRGDNVTFSGSVITGDFYNVIQSEASANKRSPQQVSNMKIKLFTVYLPPLDGRESLHFEVILDNVKVFKTPEAKRKKDN